MPVPSNSEPSSTPGEVDIDLTATDGRCYRVLIVDDRPELRILLRLRLEFEHDIDVIGEASNGVEAVELTKLLSPAAVVLDLEMPEMNGDEAIPLLRAVSPGMGILLYTATLPGSLAADAAPDAIVQKGVSLEAVVTTLRQVLGRTPFDVMRLELGTIALRQAVSAFDTWVGLNVRLLEALRRGDDIEGDHPSDATSGELEALMSVYAHIGHSLQKAARAGTADVDLVIHLRASGVLARRALLAYDDRRVHALWRAWGYDMPPDAVTALSHMRERLLKALPASAGSDAHAHATAS